MTVTPYIMFNGNCEEALNFYVKAFNGEIKSLMHFEGSPVEDSAVDKKQVMHAHFAAKGVFFMASDSGQGGPEAARNGMVHLSLNFDNAEEQQKVFQALGEEGVISMPLQDTFWGATFGMLQDKFGVNWMFNFDKPQ